MSKGQEERTKQTSASHFNKEIHTKLASRWKAVERCPELYCSAGRQSTTKKRTLSSVKACNWMITMHKVCTRCFSGYIYTEVMIQRKKHIY